MASSLAADAANLLLIRRHADDTSLRLDDRSVEKWTIKHFHCKMVYPGRSLAGTDAYESSRRARNRTRLQGWFQANDHLAAAALGSEPAIMSTGSRLKIPTES